MHPEFNAVAAEYDQGFSFTAVGKAMRVRVRSLMPPVSPGMRVLELNCGTGEDAVWMAQQGAHVVATDLSPAMIEVLKSKISNADLAFTVDAQVCGFEDLPALPESGFELVFSNFGGLNCVSPATLRNLSRALFDKTTPDAKLVLVVMSRFCWWETGYFLLKGRWKSAFRRFTRKPVSARLNEDTTVPTWYYAPSELARQFPEFRVKSCTPAGFWLPPSYLNPFFENRTGMLKCLAWLERQAAFSWMSGWSDHYVMVLRKA